MVFTRIQLAKGSALAVLFCLVLCVAPAEAQRSSRSKRFTKNTLALQQRKHRQLHGILAAALEELAQYCDKKGFTAAAADIRRRTVVRDSSLLRVDSLPKQVQPDLPAGLSAAERYWQAALRRLQKQYAKDIYRLSRPVLHAGYSSYAYRLVREAARHDPDHAPARWILGYVQRRSEWVTPFAADQMQRRYQWHDKFGWLPKTHVQRYNNGERFFKGRWKSAAQEAVLRQDFKNAWIIRTEHFEVKTNHSLERGVEIAKALEDYYRFFFETFAGFFNTPEQMQKLFDAAAGGAHRAADNKKFDVHYYRTRDEYNSRLKPKIPQIAITNGLYYTTDRTAYFFHDPEVHTNSTLYHEATHQFFYESQPRNRHIAVEENFWIVEGIACYMESLEQRNGHFSLGDPRYIRFEAARYRYLNDGYYVPLTKFTRMGMQAFQTDRNISKNYSQASGLAKFFMQYQGGRYRDALVEHLSQIYSGDRRRRNAVQSLADLAGVSFAELDRQYGEYLKSVDAALQPAQPAGN